MDSGMNTYVMRGNPCKRDCPDRQPGCNCEKRKEFQALKEERKNKIYAERSKERMFCNYEKDIARKRKSKFNPS